MLEPNTLLQNRYLVVRSIGAGGMGAVYEAVDQRLRSTVALKETFAANDEQRRAFEREAHLLANLRHPALPKVIDHFSEGAGHFLVMEYIPGEDLERKLDARALPFGVEEVLPWAERVLSALEYLHSRQPPVLHRDIKPANIKLTDEGDLYLLDFGLAKGTAGGMTAAQTSKSLYGYSAAYAPPEQIQGTGTEARSDLYALAATLYHLLTKVTPPEAFARTFQLSLGRPDPLTPADRVYPSVPRELSELLSRAMSLDIERRPASAAAMRAALRDAHAASVTRGPAATETDERPATPAQPAQGQQLAETVVPTSPAPSAQAVPQQQTPPAATQAQQYVRHEQRTTHAAPPPQPAARPAASKSRRWVWPALVLGSLLIAATIVVSFNSSGTGGANTTGGGTAATPSPGARPSPVSPSANGGAYVPTGDEGAVHGTVKFNGKAPERMPIPMDADANCLRANHNPMNEDFIVDSLGGLHNVFIYVRDGRTASGQALSELTFAPPSPLTLDRKGCQYVPHVIGIQTGQTLRVVNSDPTAHNLNVQPRSNDSFNLSQPPNSAAVERIFSRPEVMIPFKCNQHPWEKAYVGVLPHPFYVVSAQGAYEIRGLPPGTYTLVAWHERLGEKTQQITVGPHQNVTGVDFTYESRF